MCQSCDIAPYCYWCGARRARVLPLPESAALRGPVYCTMMCAALSALCSDRAAGVYWCPSCQSWHDACTGCDQCGPVRYTLAEEPS